MAYSLSTDDVPKLATWAKARTFFDDTAPLRGYTESSAKPVGRRRANNPRTMREVHCPIYGDGIAFCLWHTDVVTFYENDWIRLEGYPSISTQAVVERLLSGDTPFGHQTCWASYTRHDTTGLHNVTMWGQKVFFPNVVHIRAPTEADPHLRLRGAVTPMAPKLDMKTQHRLLRETPEYAEFRTWAKALEALSPQSYHYKTKYGRPRDRYAEALRCLRAGPSEWPALAKMGTESDSVLALLREAIWENSGEEKYVFEECPGPGMLYQRCKRADRSAEYTPIPDDVL